MVHHTKDKGDLAAVKAIADLTAKGFVILTPTVCEHLPFDLVGYKDSKFVRFQSKYSSEGKAVAKTSWSDKNGSHSKTYSELDFDYYAIYLPDKDVVCYPSVKFKGIKLRCEPSKSATPFYWYEDFLNLTDNAKKKSFRDFGVQLQGSSTPRLDRRKVVRPSKFELEELISSKPMSSLAKDFGVSDKAIAKWVKSYGIEIPKNRCRISKSEKQG